MYGGSIIALTDGRHGNDEWKATPRQWGAWRAYLSSKGIPTRFMDERGKAGKCWTVPAAWPHEFDADATVQDDHAAADWFMSRFNAVDAKFREIPAERRKAQVARLLGVKA